ncbi:hypothetical protein BIW11_03415 [Tropilaelaps mercedesae]|uniref:Uncharacterized protein n=1 Tax=Tropilaelaps mercedesae TaxID=418985 RepID=A0A1V9XLU3_9ACAR|nr:hypothetical protein BIW11_03415 [Tropilaelaps mercedesae]
MSRAALCRQKKLHKARVVIRDIPSTQCLTETSARWMLSHKNGYARLPARMTFIRMASYRMNRDGLTTAKYAVVSRQAAPLYTKVVVDIGHNHKWHFANPQKLINAFPTNSTAHYTARSGDGGKRDATNTKVLKNAAMGGGSQNRVSAGSTLEFGRIVSWGPQPNAPAIPGRIASSLSDECRVTPRTRKNKESQSFQKRFASMADVVKRLVQVWTKDLAPCSVCGEYVGEACRADVAPSPGCECVN